MLSTAGHKLPFSEDDFGKRLDRCVTDAVVKGASGMFLGGVVSLLFLKRRAWPIWMGTGFGIGAAYKGCEKDLNTRDLNSK